MPLYFRGALVPILHWLESLPTTVLDARPSLWVTYAQVLLSSGQNTGIEPKLQAAERALQDARTDDRTRDLVGRIASVRAFLVWGPHQVETIIAQSRRALEYLHPDNLPFRTAAALNLGHAYVLLGDRSGARQALTEVTAISAASGNTIYEILGSIGLGYIQELDNQLVLAVETYRHAMELAAGLPFPFVCEAHLGLARVHYQWNDLDAARQHGEQSIQLARQIADTDRPVAWEVLLARLALARGDAAGAAAILAEADRAARQHDFVLQVPEVAAAQVLAFLRLGDVAAAAHVAQAHDLPLSQARVHLAQGDPTASARGAGAVSPADGGEGLGGSGADGPRPAGRCLRCPWREGQGRGAAGRSADAGRAGRLHPHLRRRGCADGSPALRGAVLEGCIQTTFGSCWRRSPSTDLSRLPHRGRRLPGFVWPSRSARASSRCSPSSPKG